MTAKFFILLVTLSLALAGSAMSGETTSPRDDLGLFKALSGTWVSGDEDKDGKPDTTVTYRVTGSGSAVEEILFPKTPHEMVTMYHLDHGQLMLTHYCAIGNQPRMKGTVLQGGKQVSFKFFDGTNLDPAKDTFMAAADFEFLSPDRLRVKWASSKAGQISEHVTFELTRQR